MHLQGGSYPIPLFTCLLHLINAHMMKVSNILLIAGISAAMLTACGNGNNHSADSTGINTSDTAAILPDTVPAAQAPPGAINPGEDSARFGTGTADSTKNLQHKSQ
jgi:hypothetical protein